MRKKLLITTAISAIISGSLFIHAADQRPTSGYDDEKTGYWLKQGKSAVEKRIAYNPNVNQAKNVILIVGDGMSVATLSAARIYEGQKDSGRGEEHLLSFEEFPHTALVKTYNTNAQIADSAGTATALNTGVKTRIGAINTGPEQKVGLCEGTNKHTLTPIAAYAEQIGMSTGIISTARLTHATPAAVYANASKRGWESNGDLPNEAIENGCKDIASQLHSFKHGNGIDLALGGGRRNFKLKGDGKGKRTDGNDLSLAWQNARTGAKYIETREALLATDPNSNAPLLGLFTPSHMSYEVDRASNEPSLQEMSEFAIKKLSKNKKGYFLMIESGRIDHAHHDGNGYRALEEATELSQTVRSIISMVDTKETLILVTADHSHTMTIAGYSDRGNPILGLSTEEGKVTLAKDNKPYTTIGYQNGVGAIKGERETLTAEKTMDKDFIQQAAIPLGSQTHGGDDVALHAIGPWAHLARGTIEQNEIFHIIDHALQLRKRANK